MGTSSASGRRPSELDDELWMRSRYEHGGDEAISRELGVSRKAVRSARERLGIASRPPGRPRGLPPVRGHFSGQLPDVTLTQFLDGFEDDELLTLASAACLLYRERQARRAV